MGPMGFSICSMQLPSAMKTVESPVLSAARCTNRRMKVEEGGALQHSVSGTKGNIIPNLSWETYPTGAAVPIGQMGDYGHPARKQGMSTRSRTPQTERPWLGLPTDPRQAQAHRLGVCFSFKIVTQVSKWIKLHRKHL